MKRYVLPEPNPACAEEDANPLLCDITRRRMLKEQEQKTGQVKSLKDEE